MNVLEPDRSPSYHANAQSRSQTQPSPKALAGKPGAPPNNGRLPFAASSWNSRLAQKSAIDPGHGRPGWHSFVEAA
jgi:hypothetical protein